MSSRATAAAMGAAAAFLFAAADPAGAAVGQITKLTDVTFTSLNPLVAASSAQSICVYSAGLSKQYSIKATGSGTGSAFTLSAGGSVPVLPYGVAWSASSGQSSGTALTSGTPLASQTSTATTPTCSAGPATTASLIVSLTPTDLQGAVSGVTYTGTLTLVVTAQ